MPELPEVETIVRGLRQRLTGRVVEGVAVTHPSILRTAPAEFIAKLRGARVLDIGRFGKFALFRMAAKARVPANAREFWWVVHLGMTGQLILASPDSEVRQHTHAFFEFEGLDESLRYTDIRRFGRMELASSGTDGSLPARLHKYGPDPLQIPESDFAPRLRQRRARLKALLLDQHFLSGIGNIYADEILFRARLHPATLGSRLSRERAKQLFTAMREVLDEAIAHGGSSISDYVDSTGGAGSFQDLHRVYGRGGQPCTACGRTLARRIIAGRGTTFCPHCQKKR